MMKRFFFIPLLFIIFISLFKPFISLSVASTKRILLISSYHPSFPTFDKQVAGVRSVFEPLEAQVDVEFIDSKRIYKDDAKKQFYKYLSWKLKKLPPYDGIITADDNALSFVLQHQKELFAGLPIVFCGVNNQDLALSQNKNQMVTGVVEAVSMKETLETIMKLFPETKKIIAIADDTPSGQGDLVTFKKFSSEFPLDYIDLSHISFKGLSYNLNLLKNGNIVLLLSAYRDKFGDSISFKDSLQLITQNSSVPIFHLWYHGMGKGIFGGIIISQFKQAETAAEILKEIIYDGKSVNDFPVVSKSPNVPLFDYVVLEQYGIEMDDLPKDSTVINEPYSIYEENKVLVWTIIIAFIIESISLLGLIINMRIKKSLARELKMSEQQYRELFEYSPVALLEEDFTKVFEILQSIPPGEEDIGNSLAQNPELIKKCVEAVKVLNVNKEAVNLFQAKNKEDLCQGLHTIFFDTNFDVFIEGLTELCKGNNSFTAVAQQQTLQKDVLWTVLNTTKLSSLQGNQNKILVGIQDITQIIAAQEELEKSNQAKDILLREVHHRVNNNFAIITSLLDLQSSNIEDVKMKEILMDALLRIQSMALVHKKLYQKADVRLIKLNDFISDILYEVNSVYENPEKIVNMVIDCEEVVFSREVLIPLGLIVTEITSNAYKHAFSVVQKPELRVSGTINKNDCYELSISDNGISFSPEEVLHSKENRGIGLSIIDTLLRQINSQKEIISNEGITYKIVIPLKGNLYD